MRFQKIEMAFGYYQQGEFWIDNSGVKAFVSLVGGGVGGASEWQTPKALKLCSTKKKLDIKEIHVKNPDSVWLIIPKTTLLKGPDQLKSFKKYLK